MNDVHSFLFDGSEIGKDRLHLFFRYVMTVNGEKKIFSEEIALPQPVPEDIPSTLLAAIMQGLHLILGISYWKLTCPANMVMPYRLDRRQAAFWNTIYTKGLGEFFYRNNIDYRGLVNFPYADQQMPAATQIPVSDRSLLGIAGGKDSLLSARFLAEEKIAYTGIVFETGKPYPLIDEVLPFLQSPVLKVRRIIDPQLYELNHLGVYNGHIPISAVYAFLGMAAACFYGFKYVVVSNEKSANYGNVMYRGMEVNHQWSKSEEFERMFREYVARYVSPSVIYFSLLRSLNELQIVGKFIGYPELLPHFSSCNTNFKIRADARQKWCGSCPKCAFVFALLSAYLPRNKVVELFGKDLFADSSLLKTYRQLLGIADFKPFECVGTPEEVRTAFSYIKARHEFEGTPVMDMFLAEVAPVADKAEEETGSLSLLPEPFHKLMEKQV